jgi:hypothetical protein
MKSFLETRAFFNSIRGSGLLRSAAIGTLALVALCGTSRVYGQGAYYPVNPPGSTTYTGITIHSNPNLQYLQAVLSWQSGGALSLQVPLAGATAPNATQYAAAVNTAVTGVLGGPSTIAPVPGVTLTGLVNESIAWNLSFRTTTATAIAQSIMSVDSTSQAITDLTTVTQALATSQPTQIDSILPSILAQAGAVNGTAVAIPQLVVAAANQIPTDLTRIGSLATAGASAINSSHLPLTGAGSKNSLFISSSSGYIFQLMHSTAASGNPSVIQIITQSVTYSAFLSMAPLSQIVMTAETVLPVQNNNTLAAVADGALQSEASSAASIKSTLQTNAPAGSDPSNPATSSVTYSAYVGAVVDGYTNGSTLSNFTTYVTANPTLAAAAAAGAVVKGSIGTNTILQNALTLGTGTVTDLDPSQIVAAALLANVNSVTNTIVGAINASTHQPYGYPYSGGETIDDAFGKIALGAAEGSPIQNIGNMTQYLIANSGSLSALSSAVVNAVVTQSIDGATTASNTGAYGDIVYKAEAQARNTAGISGSLVTTAISEITAKGGLPYIAPVAAAAGDLFGTNRVAIKTAADAALTSTNKAAADEGLQLVQDLQTGSTTTFTKMLSHFNTAQGISNDAVRADVYAAEMADSSEHDAALAIAIKQTYLSQSPSITDATLLSDAENAIRGINANYTANLQMVDTVVTHIQSEALGTGVTPVGPPGVGDLFDFVSHQIVISSSLTNDIAIAATVVDPDHAHFIASAIAFQAPTAVAGTIGSIFTYAQITNPHPLALAGAGPLQNANGALGTKLFPGSMGAILDQPAAAAAITAGVTTGILEANLGSGTQAALSSAVAAAVAASITQNGTALRGPTNPFNASVPDQSLQFQQSTGTSPTASTGAQTVGAAGAITGYVAEVTKSTDTTISATTIAVLTASVGGGARPYALQMAQAAAQAFAWVTGLTTASPAVVNNTVGNPVFDIANAIEAGVGSAFATLPALENAVAFGIDQAEHGMIGAGALGLNATGLNLSNGSLVVASTGNNNADFYIHRSATGIPVTDIFNL